jgi:hypothetical protein
MPHLLQGKRRPETPVKIWGDPTVGFKDMTLSNPYTDLKRRDLHLTEWRIHIYSKEKGIPKLL